jgi:bleomycin hydrolase
MEGISDAQLSRFREQFASDVNAKIAQNAVTSTSVNAVTLNRQIVQDTDTVSFSHQVDTGYKVTNQKSSGRCWLFATLNLLRMEAMKRLNVKEFEFSQSHIHFWDKFERSNHFLEAMIELADRDIDDRTVAYLLGDPIGDGGQWCMAVNLIRKHGLVPKNAYPESQSSSETRWMNANLQDILRSSACELREILGSSPSAESIARAKEHKEVRLADIWRFLCIHLGTPPETFSWSWKDKNGKYNRWRNGASGTPLDFCADFAGALSADESSGIASSHFEDYVCLVHDPRNPFMQTYTVNYLQSVAGGPPVVYLNVDVDTMKDVTRRQLQAGLAVWMGCDVGKQFHRSGGVWDKDMFEYEALYGFKFGMSKANRLLHGQTLMTHAM